MADKPRHTITEQISEITGTVKRLGNLYVDKVRLKTTERLTILLSTIAFTALIIAIALIFMVFVTIGVGHLLATTFAPHLAYLMVAAFYLLVLIVAMCLRKQLFINPISRFLSRLLLQEPEPTHTRRKDRDDDEDNDDKPANVKGGEL